MPTERDTFALDLSAIDPSDLDGELRRLTKGTGQ